MQLINYLEKSRETKTQILEHQRNSPRHSNFFDENNNRDGANGQEMAYLPSSRLRRSSLPISVTIPTK